jgi:hypothetical protein
MAKATTTPTSAGAIAGFVEPLRAGGAILGFAVGFLATYRSGGALPESTIHGLVGALLLGPVGWFLGLVLIREAIRANIEDQTNAHNMRVQDAKRQLVEQLQASGHAVPPGLLDGSGDRRQLGSGS